MSGGFGQGSVKRIAQDIGRGGSFQVGCAAMTKACVCVRVCVRACVRVCVRVCVRACVEQKWGKEAVYVENLLSDSVGDFHAGHTGCQVESQFRQPPFSRNPRSRLEDVGQEQPRLFGRDAKVAHESLPGHVSASVEPHNRWSGVRCILPTGPSFFGCLRGKDSLMLGLTGRRRGW